MSHFFACLCDWRGYKTRKRRGANPLPPPFSERSIVRRKRRRLNWWVREPKRTPTAVGGSYTDAASVEKGVRLYHTSRRRIALWKCGKLESLPHYHKRPRANVEKAVRFFHNSSLDYYAVESVEKGDFSTLPTSATTY